ncbi:hypothetical protein MELA_02487 [Candidatus Methylomirabilis lanthanidiphila]|uniref:Uncharacterized protein n=1 Tax=Candidatus Methylomirabilis lanthanidiphila TaxID=2211376 RepID=A0A564ZN70_9BACT|nr:hypothetical protein MELA_02487 [Candidatus Methylomirabilis lanthanidiphila]
MFWLIQTQILRCAIDSKVFHSRPEIPVANLPIPPFNKGGRGGISGVEGLFSFFAYELHPYELQYSHSSQETKTAALLVPGLVQLVFREAKMVSDLVQQSDTDLRLDLLIGPAALLDRSLVQGDLVREDHPVRAAPR